MIREGATLTSNYGAIKLTLTERKIICGLIEKRLRKELKALRENV